MITKDQRSAQRDPAAFALRKLKEIQRQCCAQKSVNDIWLTVTFAVYDLNLMNARRRKKNGSR